MYVIVGLLWNSRLTFGMCDQIIAQASEDQHWKINYADVIGIWRSVIPRLHIALTVDSDYVCSTGLVVSSKATESPISYSLSTPSLLH